MNDVPGERAVLVARLRSATVPRAESGDLLPARFALELRPDQDPDGVAASAEQDLADLHARVTRLSALDPEMLVLDLLDRALVAERPAACFAAGYALAERFDLGNGVTQFDNFLAAEVPRITGSPAFGDDGVLLITYDEGTSNKGPGSSKQFAGGGNVIFAALGPLVNPGVYGSSYNHYSLLRTWKDGYGITEHPAHAADATPINTIWK